MIEIQTDTIRLLGFENLSAYKDIKNFITTRTNGFSSKPYHSLNLGLHVSDDPAKVNSNRLRLAAEVGMPLNCFTFAKQVHGNTVTVVKSKMKGMGMTEYESAIDSTDAMVTNSEDTCLMILVADCVPVLFYDPVKRVVAAVHAGWKGTASKITSSVVEVMTSEFGSSPDDILAGIGPSIGPCCYEVGTEVITEIERTLDEDFISRKSGDKGHLDLWEANRRQLLESGIPDSSIEVAGICTCCNTDTFYSHRCEGETGRFGAGIFLRNEICASCTAIHCNWCNK